jgi:hypothetical protein
MFEGQCKKRSIAVAALSLDPHSALSLFLFGFPQFSSPHPSLSFQIIITAHCSAPVEDK